MAQITEARIKYIAQHCTTWTFQHLIAVTDIDRATAMSAAKDAGDAFAHGLTLDLKEHGVEIVQEEES